MKLKESLVSVLIPVYNAGRFLPDCLETILKQTHNEVEIIAVDDRSKDNSLRILKKFKRNYSKIQIIQNKKHYGPAICYNRALRAAKGQFLVIMNPNDMISLHKFKRQVNYLKNNPKTVAVGSQYVTIDENNKKIKKSSLPQEHEVIYHTLLPSLSLKPETVMINRMLLPKDLIQFTGGRYPLIFTEVYIKLLQYGKITNLSQSFYQHRKGIRRYTSRTSKLKHTFSLIQLLLKSRSSYDYRPSFRSIFPPLVKEI